MKLALFDDNDEIVGEIEIDAEDLNRSLGLPMEAWSLITQVTADWNHEAEEEKEPEESGTGQ